jgi:hypothetical protein
MVDPFPETSMEDVRAAFRDNITFAEVTLKSVRPLAGDQGTHHLSL